MRSSTPPRPKAIRAIRTTTTGQQEGFGYYQVTQKKGRRWSTARAFLDPARGRPNLRVETEAYTTRILLEGKRAVGVEYRQHGQTHQVRCNAEVILAAGAVKSPHVLELSGIGQPELLQSLGIEVKHELRGVGENYRDHFAPRMNWRVKLPVTLNEHTRGLHFAKEIVKYYTQQRGVLTFTAGIVYGFVKTRPELEEPDMQYHFTHASYATAQTRVLDRQPGMTLTAYQCSPESKGSIHAKSGRPDGRAGDPAEFPVRGTGSPHHRRGHEDRPADHQQPSAGHVPRIRDEPRRHGADRR